MREKNPDLRRHITKHIHFIKLIYALRELIIHREMLSKLHFEDIAGKWNANFIAVDANVVDLVRRCGDRSQNYEPITTWGLYTRIPERYFLEPYRFSKAATTTLIRFCDTFLQLLGFDDFAASLEGQAKKDVFRTTMRRFIEDSLGF